MHRSIQEKIFLWRKRDRGLEIQRTIGSHIIELLSGYNVFFDRTPNSRSVVGGVSNSHSMHTAHITSTSIHSANITTHGDSHLITYPYGSYLSMSMSSRGVTMGTRMMVTDGSKSDDSTGTAQLTHTEQGKEKSAIDFSKRDMMMLFTCGKCDTRAAKAFSKKSYNQGVVIVECPGCKAKHLVADHLGWFGSKGTIEDFAKETGAKIDKRIADNTLELTLEDLDPTRAKSKE
jgi:hypothetical protein